MTMDDKKGTSDLCYAVSPCLIDGLDLHHMLLFCCRGLGTFVGATNQGFDRLDVMDGCQVIG